MRALSLFITLPLTVFALSFAVSNPDVVGVSLWPFDGVLLRQPLAAVALTLLCVGFVAGALFASLLSWSVRLTLWRERRRNRRLETQIRALEETHQQAPPAAPSPAAPAPSLPPVV